MTQKTKVTKEQLIDYLNNGLKIKEVAEKLNCSTTTVGNWIRKFEITNPNKKRSGKGRKPGFKHPESFKKLLSKKFKGEGNPFFGRKHTKETRKKMSKNHADFSGNKNPFTNKYYSDSEFRKFFKEKHVKLWKNRDEKWRKNFSEKLSKSMSESEKHKGAIHKNHISGLHISNKCIEGFFYKSSWELYFALCLDKNKYVDSYKYENLNIKYYDFLKNMNRYTIIDFDVLMINNERFLVEIKPKPLLELQKDKILGQKIYCVIHNLQYLLLTDEFFFDKKKINKELYSIYNKEKYIKTYKECECLI